MPYRLRKAPKRDAYWVVDDSGKHYSKDPLPKERAREQQKALYASEARGKGQFVSRIRNRNEPRAPDYRPTGFRAIDVAYADPERHDPEEPSVVQRVPSPPSPKPKKKDDPTPLRAKGLCGGQKRPYETEEQYQERLLKGEQQQRRLAEAGITPEMRKTEIAKSARGRLESQLKAYEAQRATEQAYEADPRTIAKRAELARKAEEDAVFNPLLRGAIELGKNLGKLPGVPSWLGKVSETTASALGEQMDREAMLQQQRQEQEARGAQYASQLASDEARLRSQLSGGFARFGATAYFGQG